MSLVMTVISAMLAASPVLGQNTVTTPGGTANNIPIFSSSTSIVNSGYTISPTTGLNWGCSTNPSSFTSDQGGNLIIGGLPNKVPCVNGQTPYIDFHFGSGNPDTYNFRLINNANNRLDFNNVAGNAMTISGTKVGIGTTAPTQALDLVGNARISGTGAGLIFPDGSKQTVAAVGTITGVTAGSGLAGGGTSGNVALSVDGTVIRSNASPTFGWVQANGAFSSFTGVNGAFIGLVPSGVAAWLRNTNSVPGIGTGDIIQGHGVNSVRVFRVDNVGSVFALNGYFTSGIDFAESIRVVGKRSQYEPGDVLVIDGNSKERFALSTEPYSTLVAGVYSTKPGITASPHPVMGLDQLAKYVPLGVIGIVPTKASTENGAIAPGDLLVTSATPGYVMKGTDRDRMLGAVIGKSLEPLSSGTGKIQVLITLQ
jgi:hypothetical protein